MKALAEARLRQAEQAHPSLAGRWWVLPGDITKPMLGVPQDRWDRLTETIEVVWHLAAIYDLSVSAQLAYLVNVTGTIHVLELCEACPRFARLNYVSTCYVSGERTGRIFGMERQGLEGQSLSSNFIEVDHEYAETYGLETVAGRGLRATDHNMNWPKIENVVVNEAAVEQMGFEKPEEAVGAVLKFWGKGWRGWASTRTASRPRARS